MRDELFNRPLRVRTLGFAAAAGRQLGAVLRCLAFAAAVALLTLARVLLALARPFVVLPLTLAVVGGGGATLAFAAARMWPDTARAGMVTLVAALMLGLFERLAHTGGRRGSP